MHNTTTNSCAARSRKLAPVILAGVLFAVTGIGCRPRSQAPRAGSSNAATPASPALKAPGEAKIGDRTTCAMHSDSVFTVTASTPKAEHQGRTYYFCCPECAKQFAEHPGDFVR